MFILEIYPKPIPEISVPVGKDDPGRGILGMFFHGSSTRRGPFRYPYVHVVLPLGEDPGLAVQREMFDEDTDEGITKIFELPPEAGHQDLLAYHLAISTVYGKTNTLECRFYDTTHDGEIHSFRYHPIDKFWEDTTEEQPRVVLTEAVPNNNQAFTQLRCELCCEKCCASVMWATLCQDHYLYRSDAKPEESLGEIRVWLRSSYILDRNPHTIDPEDFHHQIPVCVSQFIDRYTREYHVSSGRESGRRNHLPTARQLF